MSAPEYTVRFSAMTMNGVPVDVHEKDYWQLWKATEEALFWIKVIGGRAHLFHNGELVRIYEPTVVRHYDRHHQEDAYERRTRAYD